MITPFAEWLQEQRLARGWLQKDLALAVGVSQQTVSRWLADQAVPTVRNARALSTALGVPTDEIVGRLGLEASGSGPGSTEELVQLRRRVEQLEAQLQAGEEA